MGNKKVKILIADDEPIGRDLLEAILSPEGYDLIFGCDGEDAYNTAIEHHPDIILLDVMMPKMDGFEICEKLRKIKETAQTPIFLITALDDRDSKIRGIDAGANDYISKPFDRIEILAKVKNSAILINSRSKNTLEPETDKTPSNPDNKKSDLFKELCDLHFTQEIKEKGLLMHKSLSPMESSHAFFHSKSESGTLYYLISNSFEEKKAVIMNLYLKELLVQNARKNPDSPLKIVKETFQQFHDSSSINSIAKSNKLELFILVLLQNKNSDNFLVSGNNQTIFVRSLSEPNNLPSNNSSYQPIVINDDQELEIAHPASIFLFSSSFLITSSEQEVNTFLNETYTSDKQVDIAEVVEKFRDNHDIIIVNYSI